MPRGHPDYQVPDMAAAVPVTDMNTLIVANGIGASIDSLGRVVMWERFEQGLARWSHSAGGSGVDPYVNFGGGDLFGSSFYAKLEAKGLATFSQIQTRTHYPPSSTYGLEVHAKRITEYANLLIWMWCVDADGVGKRAEVAIYGSDFVAEVTTPSGSEKVIYPAGVATLADMPFVIKFVADVSNGTFKRMSYAGQHVDLTEHELPNAAGLDIPGYVLVEILSRANSSANYGTWAISQVILTVDEP